MLTPTWMRAGTPPYQNVAYHSRSEAECKPWSRCSKFMRVFNPVMKCQSSAGWTHLRVRLDSSVSYSQGSNRMREETASDISSVFVLVGCLRSTKRSSPALPRSWPWTGQYSQPESWRVGLVVIIPDHQERLCWYTVGLKTGFLFRA